MTFDVSKVRAAYPALADGYAYLDGAAGTQVPEAVIGAIADVYRAGIGNAGGAFPASQRADEIIARCRLAVADMTGGVPEGVILGPNMTTLARTWGQGDEVIVSRLDHDANVRPWIQAAGRAGAKVRWAEIETETGELPAAQYDDLLSERTRLVAVTAASNILGTRPDVPTITAKAHAVGALTYVDGVHATPHGPVDVAALGADFFATSAYKWSGPHVGAVVSDPVLLARLNPDKLASSPSQVPDRFETGTPPYADFAGVAAAVDYLAALHNGGLDNGGLHNAGLRRTATAYFTVSGYTPRDVAEHLASRKVNVWNGHNYAWELTAALGIRDTGSAVRAGLVHYNDRSDVDRLLDGVAELASS